MNMVDQIQSNSPDEPDWALLDEAFLIELVREFKWAPDVAGSALSELSDRNPEIAGDLCLYLLTEQEADRWLKYQAVRQLPETHRAQGFDLMFDLIHQWDVETLALLVDGISKTLDECFPVALRKHPLIGIVDVLSSREDTVYFAGSLTRENFIEQARLRDESPLWKYSLAATFWAFSAALLAKSITAAAMLLILIVALGWFTWNMKKIAVSWDCNPDYRKHFFGMISEEGIYIFKANHRSFVPWSNLGCWNFSDQMIVMWSQTNIHIFPQSFFKSSFEWARVHEICRAKLTFFPKFKVRHKLM